MVEIKGVHGSEEAAAPLIVGVTTVYVHSNVEKVLDEEGQETGMYKYDEIQYTKDEWIKLMAKPKTTERLIVRTSITFFLSVKYEILRIPKLRVSSIFHHNNTDTRNHI